MEKITKQSVYLKPAQVELVKKVAAAEGLTVSAWIRRIVLRECEEWRKAAREEEKPE